MKKLFAVLMIGLFFACGLTGAYADTYVKLLSDKKQSDVYVNGEIAGTFYDVPLEFILPPGEYLIEVKKENGDGSYDYFKRNIKAGKIDTKVPINAQLKREYPESYYYKNANTIEGAQAYLDKYPSGKFSVKISSFLEMEYAKSVANLEDAKKYFERYPKGRYKEAVLNKEIYLTSYRKETRNGETETDSRTYNNRGQLVEKLLEKADGTWTKYSNAYDSKGRLVRFLVKESDGDWGKSSYTYNDRMQLIEEYSEKKARNPLKTLYTYDENSNLTEESIFGPKHLKKKNLYAYDGSGNLTKERKETYNVGRYTSFLSYEITYAYDEKKNLLEKYEEHLKNGAWEKITYWYDDKGTLIKRRKQESGGYREFDKTYHYGPWDFSYQYDDNGKIDQEIKKSKTSGFWVKTIYKYGENGNLAEKNQYFKDDRRIQYLYDVNENLIEEFYHPDSDGDTHKIIFKYTARRLKDMYPQ